MRERFDGSLQSTNVPTSQNVTNRDDDTMYRCMVVKVLFTDDKDNITTNADNPEVLYDVVILGGGPAGQIISNCRLSSILGGNNNYYERILRGSSKKLNTVRLNEHDGDIVFIQFIQGHSAYPVIIALDKGIKTNYTPATKEDGQRLQWQFNGIFQEINKSGEYCLVRHGGSIVDGVFVPNKEVSYSKKLLKNEIVEERFFTGMKNYWDGKTDIHTREYEGGLKITEDGKSDKVEISTAGGALIEVDGKSGKITITAKDTIVEIDGDSGNIKLSGKSIDLGASVTDLVTKFMDLATEFAMHTHPYIDATGPAATPVPSVTMPPTAPLIASIGSQTVKVQD